MAFRKLTRSRQALSREECLRILREEKRGVLSVQGDDGYPYGVPINHYYCEEDGRLYFHSGMTGHKIDAIRRDDKVSFCVYDQGTREGDDWPLHIKSVVAFGRVEILENRGRIYEIARRLSEKFTRDQAYIDREIQRSGPATLMFSLRIEHMCGKLVKES